MMENVKKLKVKQKTIINLLIGAISSYLTYLYFNWLWDGIIIFYTSVVAFLIGPIIIFLLHLKKYDASTLIIIISTGIGGLWPAHLGTYFGVFLPGIFGIIIYSLVGVFFGTAAGFAGWWLKKTMTTMGEILNRFWNLVVIGSVGLIVGSLTFEAADKQLRLQTPEGLIAKAHALGAIESALRPTFYVTSGKINRFKKDLYERAKEKAILAYQEVIEKYPDTKYEAEAHFRLSLIYFPFSKSLEEELELYEKFMNEEQRLRLGPKFEQSIKEFNMFKKIRKKLENTKTSVE
jgi:tetratricopeptide (TPR) repeat protein